MIECSVDGEWRSDVDIKRCGAYRYFESPHCLPLILCWSIDREPVRTWTILEGRECPPDLAAHVRAGGLIRAFNAAFERLGFKWLAEHWGWPEPRLEQYRCTQAQAAALGLPRKLETLGDALDLKQKKDKRGSALIRKFSQPYAPGPLWSEPRDHPAEFEEFCGYCRQDVATEADAGARMIPLSDAEQRVWEMDQRINQRGIRIDTCSARAAIALVGKDKTQLDAQMRAATGGAVPACTNVAKLTAWCGARGVAMEGVAKDDVSDALELADLPADVESALRLRQEAGKSSTSKIESFLRHACRDNRVRGAFQFHATHPGRWSSTGVNLGNMPRPRAVFADAHIDAASLFEAIRTEDPDWLRALYGPDLGRPLHLVSDAIRGFCWADPGKEFIAADYASIQGALCAWLSKEEWKLTAMREIIADPSRPDLYRRAAAGILNLPIETVTKKHWARQALGKPSELALQFQGGVAALLKMATAYGIKGRDLHGFYPHIWAAATPEAHDKAAKRWEKCSRSRDRRKTDVLSREAWLACELIKTGWRRNNPQIEKAWAELEGAMRTAMREPGKPQRALGRISYLYARGFLWCRLPSDRCIAYASPRLRDQVWAKVQNEDGSWPEEAEVVEREWAEAAEVRGRARIQGATSPKVTALGVDSQTQKLKRYALYGGLAMENLCLGIERDILTRGMANVEEAGYPIVLHVYDEGVAEVPVGWGSVDEFCRLMCAIDRKLYDGLPLAASGWHGKRYHKD